MNNKPLNLEGTLEQSKNKKPTSDRHSTKRKPIALNFSDLRRPYASALGYWKKNALVSPLVWLIFDKLGEQEAGTANTVKNVSGSEFAKVLIEDLRKIRK